MFPVGRKKIIEITEHILEAIKQGRMEFFQKEVRSVLEEHNNKKTFFKKKLLTVEEAEKKVRRDWDLFVPPLWISWKDKDEARALKLLSACKITTEEVIQLDADDASLLSRWQEK